MLSNATGGSNEDGNEMWRKRRGDARIRELDIFEGDHYEVRMTTVDRRY